MANALAASPYILNAFVAGFISEAVSLENWRWGVSCQIQAHGLVLKLTLRGYQYGMFVIIVPVAMAPALVILFWADRKAKKNQGETWRRTLDETSFLTMTNGPPRNAALATSLSYSPPETQRRTMLQTTLYWWSRIDGFGLILLGTGFSLILLPFTLYTRADNGWKNRGCSSLSDGCKRGYRG
jgi:hypothetical protein